MYHLIMSTQQLYEMIQNNEWISYILNGLSNYRCLDYNWITKDKFIMMNNNLMILENDGSIVNVETKFDYSILIKTLKFIYLLLNTKKLNNIDSYNGYKGSNEIFNNNDNTGNLNNWIYLQFLFYKSSN